jgi:hypothetical protein
MSDNNKSELEKNLKLLYDDIQIEYTIKKQKIDQAINKLNTIRPILILIETIICLFGSVIAGMILDNYIIPNISLIAIAILAVTVIFMGIATMHLNCELQSLKDKIAAQKINEYKENNIIIDDDVKILSVLFNKFSE